MTLIGPVNKDFSIGLHFGIRFGIGGEELIDFIVGIFGFDPNGDDIFDLNPIYRELLNPIKRNETWESKVDALDEKMDRKVR